MRVVARRVEGYAHDVELEGGHDLRVDEPSDKGGTDTGPRPTQLLGASLAGCIAITVEMYADRKGWDVGELEVEVAIEYTGPVPTHFDVALRCTGDLDAEQLERLRIVAGKCPVHKALASESTVAIHDRVETDL